MRAMIDLSHLTNVRHRPYVYASLSLVQCFPTGPDKFTPPDAAHSLSTVLSVPAVATRVVSDSSGALFLSGLWLSAFVFSFFALFGAFAYSYGSFYLLTYAYPMNF